jgi:D-lactate dehydrogenase (cytochrome)
MLKGNDIYNPIKSEIYLRDQSNLSGNAEAIAFVTTSDEAIKALQFAREQNKTVTIQGSRTGVNGGAVPMGGYIINFSRMNKITSFTFDEAMGIGTLGVQAGVTVEQIERILNSKHLGQTVFDSNSQAEWLKYQKSDVTLTFEASPSEKTATIGGMIACNASNAGMKHGNSIVNQILKVQAILPNGEILSLSENNAKLDNKVIAFSDLGQQFRETVTNKNPYEAGYNLGNWIDLLCGSEGTLALITGATIKLQSKPAYQYGLSLPFSDAKQLFSFWKDFQNVLSSFPENLLCKATCFDRSCLSLLQNQVSTHQVSRDSALFDESSRGATLLLELGSAKEDDLFEVLETILIFLKKTDLSEDCVSVSSNQNQLSAMLELEHRVLDAITLLPANIERYSADICVTQEKFSDLFMYISEKINSHELSGMLVGQLLSEQISFCLINGYNVSDIYQAILNKAAETGCKCSSKYGVGRKKLQVFKKLSAQQESIARQVKGFMDPHFILNKGVLFNAKL